MFRRVDLSYELARWNHFTSKRVAKDLADVSEETFCRTSLKVNHRINNLDNGPPFHGN